MPMIDIYLDMTTIYKPFNSIYLMMGVCSAKELTKQTQLAHTEISFTRLVKV